MLLEVGIGEASHDLAPIVDPVCPGALAVGDIDGREGAP